MCAIYTSKMHTIILCGYKVSCDLKKKIQMAKRKSRKAQHELCNNSRLDIIKILPQIHFFF